jgi:hypothetical protein
MTDAPEPQSSSLTIGLTYEVMDDSIIVVRSGPGRVARAWVAGSPGVYRPEWSIDQVAEDIDTIRDTTDPWVLPTVPSAFTDHISRSFRMASSS